MPSPFPGMDPYIEDPDRWPGFHPALAGEVQALLAPLLRPRYYAEIEPRVFTEDSAAAIVIPRLIRPDVAVLADEHQEAPESGLDAASSIRTGSVTIAPAPIERRVKIDTRVKLLTVSVRTIEDDRLVTSIELLSPVNKRPGTRAYRGYHRKREELLHSAVHLLEIDLLRAGERPPMDEPLPDAPYFIILSRVDRRPVAQVWPVQLADPLPVVPVPLLSPDPDVPLDLGGAVAAIYERAAYDMRIDYSRPPPGPPLSAEEAAWLEAHLKREGRRP